MAIITTAMYALRHQRNTPCAGELPMDRRQCYITGKLIQNRFEVAATPDAAGRCQAAAAVASRAGRWLRCMLGVAVPLGLIHSFGYRDRTQLTIFFVRTYMR